MTRSTNEQTQTDENARPTRLTRAKSANTQQPIITTRKRAALGDVSNQANHKPKAQPLKSKLANEKKNITTKIRPNSIVEEPPTKQRKTLPSSPELLQTTTTTTTQPKVETPPPAVTLQQEWDDLDADDMEDPLMVSEYVVEIFNYLREQELLTLPTPDYMDNQKDLHWKMRGILVDWLVEVHQKFRLLPETLFLAVNIIDRFLSLRVCSLPKLQLVGITALFIASKYEEVMCPSIQNFIYMADGGYTDDEILKAEQYVLQVLDFNLSFPNPMNFLRRVSKADQYDIQVRTVAKYLLEISLVDHRFLVYPPSLVAAAGMYFARYMLDRGCWDANLIHYSGYTEGQIIGCVRLMIDYLQKPIRHEAFYKKYASKKFIKASLYVTHWVAKEENVALFEGVVDTGNYAVENDVDY